MADGGLQREFPDGFFGVSQSLAASSQVQCPVAPGWGGRLFFWGGFQWEAALAPHQQLLDSCGHPMRGARSAQADPGILQRSVCSRPLARLFLTALAVVGSDYGDD